MAYVRETVQYQNQPSSSLPIKIQTAYDILQSHKLSFDIPQIDKCLDLTDRAGSSSLCIMNAVEDGSSSSNWQQRHVNDILLTRLSVRALLSRRQGGFDSPSVIFIDAGNCSDIYQCVNFARQYGLDIQKVTDGIIVSRPFNIYQLAGFLIDELDAAVVKERFGAKLVVISDLLKMFAPQQQDSQIDTDEALWLLKEIARSLRRLSAHELLVVSIRECPAQYRRVLFPLFDNQIHIGSRPTNEPGRFQVKVKYEKIDQGLDFLLKHFGAANPWPRTITRSAVNKRQYEVDSKATAMLYFQGALGYDCRINAFGLNQTNLDLIFMDVDTTDGKILADILYTIDCRLGSSPTVYHSGRGYHVVQPIRCPIDLDTELTELKELVGPYENVSDKFLQFAKRYLSNGKSDPSNNPALKSCLLRIPGSINSKNNAHVTVIQEWDGYRPYYRQLYDAFYQDLRRSKQQWQRQRRNKFNNNNNNGSHSIGTLSSSSSGIFQIPQHYRYIEEKLLKTPLEDDRKLVVGIILSRYLINIKGLEYDQAHEIIWQWLDMCARLRPLQPRKSQFDRDVVKHQLKLAQDNGIPAMTEHTLKEKYPGLYSKLWTSGES
jgi:hypothetical protein